MSKYIAAIAVVLSLVSPAFAKGKASCQVAFVAKGHLIHYDYLLSQKAATELAASMNELKLDDGAKHFVIVVEGGN